MNKSLLPRYLSLRDDLYRMKFSGFRKNVSHDFRAIRTSRMPEGKVKVAKSLTRALMQRDEVVTDVSVRFRACNVTNTQCGFAREIFYRYIGSYNSSESRSTLRALNTRPRGPSSGYTVRARSKKGESTMKHRIVYIIHSSEERVNIQRSFSCLFEFLYEFLVSI